MGQKEVFSPTCLRPHGVSFANLSFLMMSHKNLCMRCPCFVVNDHQLLLPSFGTWTGGTEVPRTRNHRYFAIAGPEVFEVTV